MVMNDLYESVDGKASKTDELTADTGYETVDKYNKGYVYSGVPQPYEEIKVSFPPPPPPSLQTVQMPPSERYGVAQCPLYASASNFDGDKETKETSFSQDKESSDDVQQGDTSADNERYVIREFQNSETEAAYATVKVDYLANVTIR